MSEFIDLNFDIKAYINTKPHKIEFKDVTHILIFSNEVTQQDKKDEEEVDIFSEKKIDYSKLLEEEVITENNVITHKLKNMVLYKSTSLYDFLKIVNSVCKCDIIHLDLVFNKNYNFVNKIPNITNYSEILKVGDESLHLRTPYNYKINYSDQFSIYAPSYIKLNEYVSSLLKESKKKPKITINYEFNKLNITYYCTKPGVNLNLVELFNIHNTDKYFKRIIIHDDILDLYTNDQNIQYVKQNIKSEQIIKHIEAKQNTLSLFYFNNIDEHIIINSIDIFKDGTFKLLFLVSPKLSINQIMTTIEEYFKKETEGITEFELLFNNLHLTQVNNGFNLLSKDDYTPKISELVSVYNIPNNNIKDIKKMDKILMFPDIKSRFKSNTSINFNFHNFINENSLYNIIQMIDNNEIVSESVYRSKVAPELHFTLDAMNNLILTSTRFTSFNELLFSLYFTLPLIQYQNLTISDEHDKLNSMLKQLRSIPTKTNLKQLLAKDPILFAPRTVDKKPRSYSALCQKQEQRPTILSKPVYDYFKKEIPESVIDLQNQTYPDQRIYLICPFEDFKYINYHHFNAQKCIVRCTTKLSNPTQYNQCANELDASDKTEFTTKYENSSIIFYNEYINHHRKCYPPNEFKDILTDYIMFSPNLSNESIVQYCHRMYNLSPFIIQRDSVNKAYTILTQIEKNNDYMLCIKCEHGDKYLIFTKVREGKPLRFSENKKIKSFFKQFFKNNIYHQNYINFVCDHVLIDYSLGKSKIDELKEKVNELKEMTINEFIKEIRNKWDCKIVYDDNKLYGIIKKVTNKKDYKEYYYPTPILSWINIDISYIKPLVVLKDLSSKNLLLPEFEQIYNYGVDESKIGVIVDPSNEEKNINGIEIKTQLSSVIICCQLKELPENMNDYLIIDLEKYYLTLFNKRHINIKVNTIVKEEDNLKMLLENYLEKYSKLHSEYYKLTQEENQKQFIKYLDDLKYVYGDENKFEYIGEYTMDLINSRIKRDDMIRIINSGDISFSKIDIEKFVYNKIINILKLYHKNNEVILKKRFI